MQALKCSRASIPSRLCYVTTTTLTSACKQTLATDQVPPTCFNAPSEVHGHVQLLGHLTCGARYWSINPPDEGSLRGYMLRRAHVRQIREWSWEEASSSPSARWSFSLGEWSTWIFSRAGDSLGIGGAHLPEGVKQASPQAKPSESLD